MPSYSSYIRQMSVLDKDDDITWITVKGNHIPIKKGQSKGDAVKEFFESKKSDSNEKASSKPSSAEILKHFEERGLVHNEEVPQGWKETEGAMTAPNGYKWYDNGESLFGGKYEHGLFPIRVDEPKVDSEIKEAFEDFPKFKIKKDYAVAENDNKRVVVEKYSDGVIGVTTETEGGELLNSAEFKSWESAATYANKQRILHKISLGEDK